MSPDAAEEPIEIIEEKDTIVVLLGETVLEDGGRWYKLFNPEAFQEPYGYVHEEAVQQITYDMLTDRDIDSLYGIAPYLAVTRNDIVEGHTEPTEVSPVTKIIPHHGTLVYLYSAYPGNGNTGAYADSYENWYYVMLPDHETYAYVQGMDLWLLDKLPVHDASYFFEYVEREQPVSGTTWQEAYLAVLEQCQAQIESYEKADELRNTKPVALCDINGDGINELLLVIFGSTGFELYDDENRAMDLNLAELLIYSYTDGEAANVLHLIAPSGSRLDNEDGNAYDDGFDIMLSDNGILISFSSSYADKRLTVEYGFDEDGLQEIGKYHDLYVPSEGGGLVYEALPETLLYERDDMGAPILCLTDSGYDELPGLSLSEARMELER